MREEFSMVKASDCRIRLLRDDDILAIADAFAVLGWDKPPAQYRGYLAEQRQGEREVLVAWDGDLFVGYVTVVWNSGYAPFREAGIPEIADFNVLPHVRRLGIGSQLLDEAERRIAERSHVAGIGVGMTADYGAAQRLYVKRGYVPDGRGLVASGHHVRWGETVLVDDDLVLYFTKTVLADPVTSSHGGGEDVVAAGELGSPAALVAS
jgi:GNAT superfamily N-acetyltransferase